MFSRNKRTGARLKVKVRATYRRRAIQIKHRHKMMAKFKQSFPYREKQSKLIYRLKGAKSSWKLRGKERRYRDHKEESLQGLEYIYTNIKR
jgi:hypothetical protein